MPEFLSYSLSSSSICDLLRLKMNCLPFGCSIDFVFDEPQR